MRGRDWRFKDESHVVFDVKQIPKRYILKQIFRAKCEKFCKRKDVGLQKNNPGAPFQQNNYGLE